VFFLDPSGNVLPCNGSDEPMVMGNLHEEVFASIWEGDQAARVRQQVRTCGKQCWMIGSAAPAMKKRIRVPLGWVARNKLKLWLRGPEGTFLDPVGPVAYGEEGKESASVPGGRDV
jgi:hypothetical protein